MREYKVTLNGLGNKKMLIMVEAKNLKDARKAALNDMLVKTGNYVITSIKGVKYHE